MERDDLQIIEDNDSNEDFDNELRNTSGAPQNSRPVSGSSNRPQSATRVRIGDPQLLYQKIQAFCASNGITRAHLSQALREYPKMSDFKAGFDDLGLHLTMDEVAILFKEQGVSKSGVIQISQILPKLLPDEQFAMQSIVKDAEHSAERVLKSSHSQKSRSTKKAGGKRPVSGSVRSYGTATTANRPISAAVGKGVSGILNAPQPRFSMDELQRELDAIDAREANLYERNAELRAQTKKKQVKEKKTLALTVDKAKREFEYESLHKMGEANEIAQSQGLPISFRALKKENGEIVCHIYEGEAFIKEIDLESFQREWRRLKKSQKGALNLFSEETRPISAANAKVNKRERQEELKKLLLDTKELTNKLKEQLKILESKGIVSKKTSAATSVLS